MGLGVPSRKRSSVSRLYFRVYTHPSLSSYQTLPLFLTFVRLPSSPNSLTREGTGVVFYNSAETFLTKPREGRLDLPRGVTQLSPFCSVFPGYFLCIDSICLSRKFDDSVTRTRVNTFYLRSYVVRMTRSYPCVPASQWSILVSLPGHPLSTRFVSLSTTNISISQLPFNLSIYTCVRFWILSSEGS